MRSAKPDDAQNATPPRQAKAAREEHPTLAIMYGDHETERRKEPSLNLAIRHLFEEVLTVITHRPKKGTQMEKPYFLADGYPEDLDDDDIREEIRRIERAHRSRTLTPDAQAQLDYLRQELDQRAQQKKP